MVPNVFISSTIQDLGHLRDSIRDVILEIGYNPIMSEYGEIGYLPTNSAEDSCYLALKDCQLAVILIGKRYGSLSNNGLSITHNEFRTIRERKIPVICLVNEEVLSFKRIYDANEPLNNLNFPGMENPGKVFQLVREFAEADVNNGVVPFTNVQSAKSNLKKQLAHIVGDLFQKYFDPVKGEIKDILSEITTLRHMLLKSEQVVARQFASAFRFLLDEENIYLKEITEAYSGSLEAGVPELLKNANLKAYLTSKGIEFRILDENEVKSILWYNPELESFPNSINKIFFSVLPYQTYKSRGSLDGKASYDIKPDDPNNPQLTFGIGSSSLLANKNAEKLLNAIYERLITVTQDK